MSKPTMVLRYGAADNSLTIYEGDDTTTIDISGLTKAERYKLRRVTVGIWKKLRGMDRQRRRRYRRRPRRT